MKSKLCYIGRAGILTFWFFLNLYLISGPVGAQTPNVTGDIGYETHLLNFFGPYAISMILLIFMYRDMKKMIDKRDEEIKRLIEIFEKYLTSK